MNLRNIQFCVVSNSGMQIARSFYILTTSLEVADTCWYIGLTTLGVILTIARDW